MIRKEVTFPNDRFCQNPYFYQLRQVSARCRVMHVQFAGEFGRCDDGIGEYCFHQTDAINLLVTGTQQKIHNHLKTSRPIIVVGRDVFFIRFLL
jgi:hypothetical protein